MRWCAVPSLVRTMVCSWWRHQMETFSALLALCAGNSPVPVNSPHKGQWRRALMFSLICARINDWVNNREAGDLRRHRGHYDVNVMVACWVPSRHQANSRINADLLSIAPSGTNFNGNGTNIQTFLQEMRLGISSSKYRPFFHSYICKDEHSKIELWPMRTYSNGI